MCYVTHFSRKIHVLAPPCLPPVQPVLIEGKVTNEDVEDRDVVFTKGSQGNKLCKSRLHAEVYLRTFYPRATLFYDCFQ